MSTPLNIYAEKIQFYTEQLQLIRRKATLVAVFRLIAFIALVATVYLMIRNYNAAYWWGIVAFAVIFLTLVRQSVIIGDQKKLASELLFVNRNEVAILKGDVNKFPDGADVSMRNMHANDLDIFGFKSLFHLLNRTTTSHGSAALVQMLNEPVLNIHEIINRQQAIKRLLPQNNIRQLITAHGLIIKEEGKIEEIDTWLGTNNRMAGKTWLNIARFLFPAIAIVAFFYYLDSNNPGPVALAVLLNWLVVSLFIKHAFRQHLLAGKKEPVLQQYASILNHFNNIDASEAAMLQQLQAVSRSASVEIFRLSRLTAMLDQRMNLIINLIANSFFQYDIHCLIALEKWKIKNKDHFPEWMKAVGKIEALNSIAAFAFNYPEYTYPRITNGKPFISGSDMGHPLIKHGEQVVNTVSIGINDKLLLVTGSNMSGKSTFLRTLGVNLLLAQCGAPVCAKKFECSPMKILSSVRISDSLQENTSYFMAELKRLHQIIEELETGIPALVLIDEVLRGTNSDDKTHGSEALIIKLLNYNCLSLFATHDLSLSVLENKFPGKVANYCFESTIINDELSFDYKLRRGVATNKNATFLMQKMGII